MFCGSTRETVSVITQENEDKRTGKAEIGTTSMKDYLAAVEACLAILQSTVLALKGEHLSPLGSPSPPPP